MTPFYLHLAILLSSCFTLLLHASPSTIAPAVTATLNDTSSVDDWSPILMAKYGFTHGSQLSSGFYLFWKLIHSQDDVTLCVLSQDNVWASIGLNDFGGMPGASIYTGWWDDSLETVRFEEMYAPEYGRPELSFNLYDPPFTTLLESGATSKGMGFVFKRPVSVTDAKYQPYQKTINLAGSATATSGNWVIWARGPDNFWYHKHPDSERGSLFLQFD